MKIYVLMLLVGMILAASHILEQRKRTAGESAPAEDAADRMTA